jgi:hypothetical protein
MLDEEDIDARQAEFFVQRELVRPITRRLINAVLQDTWPDHTVIVDFGLDSQKHYEALYYPIRQCEILPQALDAALGHGERLSGLTREAVSNPHKDVVFYTSWDVVLGRDRPKVADRAEAAPSPSQIARETAGHPSGPENGSGPENATTRRRGQ